MLKRDAWLDLARQLDWEPSYVREDELFPPVASGQPWLPAADWADWDEPFKTSFREYVAGQRAKETTVRAVMNALSQADSATRLPAAWVNALKLHAAALPLAEFAAVVGNLRAARFGRHGAWRTMATFGALDELRHTQLPLLLMHGLVQRDRQFDWTWRFYHSNDWVAIAARHLFDELLLSANPIELAIGTNFVFETGFTNLQFVALAAVAQKCGDHVFEQLALSIQTDEARHAQIGGPVLEVVARRDPAYAQYLVDKWFWRSWQLFAVLTGFSMDYLTPVEARRQSFKEFMNEWVLGHFAQELASYGLQRPWYWDRFVASLDHFHHMVYASAYTYRASVWFDFALPGPDDLAWLRQKYPRSFPALEPVWRNITERWCKTDPGNEFGVHGTAIVGFCALCQLVLCGGTPAHNTAIARTHRGRKRIFCSEPCLWIFEQELDRYAGHRDVVARVLAGEAPANLVALLTESFGLSHADWGEDMTGGTYPWLSREPRASRPPEQSPDRREDVA